MKVTQGQAAERRERARQSPVRRGNWKFHLGFQFEGRERPGTCGEGGVVTAEEKERVRDKETETHRKMGRQKQITRSQVSPPTHNSKRSHTHAHPRYCSGLRDLGSSFPSALEIPCDPAEDPTSL